MKESFRWRSGLDADVDAYVNQQEDWFLFVTLKQAVGNPEAELRKIAGSFVAGPCRLVSGALKTPKESQSLAAFSLNGEAPKEFWALEGGLEYRLECGGVLNPGLFLDQRDNRKKLSELISSANAETKDHGLLNLFSYTGSFSLVAAKAGLEKTTSVDVSQRYLNWEKANHKRQSSAGQHRLIAEDARAYVKRAIKRGEKYSWIVLDPPTFSKGQGKAFSVREDFFPLVEECFALLAPGGVLLASLNDAKMPSSEFVRAIREAANAERVETGCAPEEFGDRHPLKFAWIFAAAPKAH